MQTSILGVSFNALEFGLIVFALIVAFAAIGIALYIFFWTKRLPSGTPGMQEIANYIMTGSKAYLRKQYTTVVIIAAIVTVIIAIAGLWVPSLGWFVAIAFIFGVSNSLIAGYIGMITASTANVKTTAATQDGVGKGLKVAYYGGLTMGLCVVGLSLVGIIVLMFSAFAVFQTIQAIPLISGYAFGASFAALFQQLGGGIFTKAADMGADLVGKIEAGIPEDDPRNPGVIADNVGDQVGDCAGRSADLFESATGENIGAMILGIALFPFFGMMGIIFPLVARAFGIIAAIIGSLVIRGKETDRPMKDMRVGLYVTTIICTAFFVLIIWLMLPDKTTGIVHPGWFLAAFVGLVTSVVVGLATEYYTSIRYRPVKELAKASETGPATNVVTGLSLGLESTLVMVVIFIAAIITAFMLGSWAGVELGIGSYQGGVYGTAIATMGMLATTAYILAMDGYGPISDNAGGIAEMSADVPNEIRDRTDLLDAAGNSTKALAKAYAIGSAALAAVLLFEAYLANLQLLVGAAEALIIDLKQADIIVSLLFGGLTVFIFSAMAMRAVGLTANTMIEEIRRQFREDKGILEGTSKPDYARCVEISTGSAQRNMVIPSLLCVVFPLVSGVLFGADGVAAYLIGVTVAGILLAITFNNGGAIMDNAKKLVAMKGLKGTETHMAAIVGDTVGDPLKDTAGPSIHVLMKLVSTISLVFGGFFLVFFLI